MIIGELDVETNYLRSSAQNFGDEMHLKTVFSKRANRPAVENTANTPDENNRSGTVNANSKAIIEAADEADGPSNNLKDDVVGS